MNLNHPTLKTNSTQSSSRRRRRIVLSLIAALLLGATALRFQLAPAQAQGAGTTILVNSTVQEATAASFNGLANGNCTLGEAILSANANSDIGGCVRTGSGNPFTLALSQATYTLTAIHHYEYGPTGLPPIASRIVIEGNGAIIERDANAPRFRLLYVPGGLSYDAGTQQGLPEGNLTLRDVTLRGGLAKGGDSGDGGGAGMGAGGAIFNQGSLQLERVTLTDNQALGGSAGVLGNFVYGGGGIGQDAQGFLGAGGFGGPPLGLGGAGGLGNLLPGYGGGGGGFLPGAGGGNADISGGNGGGQGGLGGNGYDSQRGDGGGGSGLEGGGPAAAGGGFGFGGGGNSPLGGGGGGGVGGGGGGVGGGGGFGGGGSVLADGGFGAGGGSGGFGGFGGGSGRDDIGGGGGLGGAIFNHRGNLTLTNCTLTANTAQGGTGTNSAASGDDGSGLGGAIFNLNGEIRLSFSTLAANTVINGTGGAVYSLAFGNLIEDGSASEAAVELRNSILATSVDGGGNPVSDLVNDKRDGNQTNLATVTYDGPNLVMSRTEQNGATSSGSPAQTANPNLQPLALNTPGLTPTMALTPASTPALNQGACTIQVATDQRGVTRPQGAACDIGAVEVIQNNSTTAITLQIDPATDPAGAANELIGAINLANLEASATTITLMCGTYTLTERNNTFYGFTGLPVITTPITIEGNGAVIERAAPAPGFRLFAIARQDPATGGALAVPGSLTLSQVTLRGGLAQGGAGGDSSEGGGGGGAGLGGAVYNQGTLNIQRSAFIANTAQGGQGGSRVGSSGEGAGGGGLGGNGGANTFSTNGGSGGGGFGGNGGLGASTGGGGGEGGGQIANGNNGQGDIGGSGGSAEGGDGGSETPAPNDDSGSPGGFGGGGGGGNLANGGAGGIGGGGGGGSGNGPGGSGGFGGGGGGGGNNGGGGGFGGGGGGGGGFGGFGAGGGGGERGGGGAGLGGAIFNDGGALTILNSTISSNTAIGGAAGDAAAMTAQSGQGMGGGIFARNGTVTINNVTLNNNTVMQGPGQAPASAPEPEGGSLYLLGDGQPVRPGDSVNIFYKVTNSILANTPGGASDGFILTINGGELRPITNNNNLVETNGSEPNADSFDLSGVTRTEDPQLGALTAANCGSGGCHAPVHPIAATSPAFNAAGGNAETADQCGTARLSGTADIGAYEFPCMLALSPASGEFPAADAGTAFSQTFTAMNPSGAVTFLFGGSLPPGLNFTPSGPGTAQLAGIPTLPGSYSFSVTANEANGCLATQTYSLTVNCPAITIAPASLPNAQVNVAYAQVITNAPAAGFYGFAVTSGLLPAGLTLNADGSFSGAPTQSGVFNFRVTASGFSGGSGVCSSFRDYALLVECTAITVNPANLPGGNIGASYNQTVSAAPAGTYSFSVRSGALPPGLMLNAATGAITGLPAQSGTYNFRITASAGGCTSARDYTVSISCPAITLHSLANATAGANYSGSVAASPAGSYNYSLTSGSLPAGLTLNPSTGAIYGLPAVTGTFNFTVKAQTPNGCSANQSYTLTVACPTVTLSSLPTPTLNSPYNQTVTASPSGGSFGFAVTAGVLPAGLTLNSATGVISGTPTVSGSFNFTITASGFSGGFGGCAGARAYSFALGNGGCPTITLADLPNGQPGQLYNQSATASPSGDYSYAVTAGSLPLGLTLYGSLGMLFGYPTQAGTFNFTVTATNVSNCTGSKTYSVQIGGAALRSLVFGDFDGDGKADLSVWRGATGEWLTINSSDGQPQTEAWGTSAAPYFDVMTPGDYDGDGRMDAAVFRRSTSQWLIKRSSDGAVTAKAWGLATDVPVPGDYDGDGKTDIAVWRGEQGHWYVLRSSNGQTETSFWGTSNAPYRDLPVPADYDGDGRTDIAVFRQQNGHWYIRQSSDGSTIAKHWGLGTDVPVAADYDGDGKADIAIWRGAAASWYIVCSSDGTTQSISWANASPGDLPAPGDYDGDGKADAAVWQASSGTWAVRRSTDAKLTAKTHGRAGDSPITARSDR